MVKLKATVPLGILSLIFLIIGVVAASYVRSLQKSSSELVSTYVASTRSARELEIHLLEIRYLLDRYLIEGDQEYLAELTPKRKTTEHWLNEAERTANTAREMELIQEARRGYDKFTKQLDQLLKERPAAELYGNIRPLIDRILNIDILQPAHAYEMLNEEMLTRTSNDNEKLADRLVIVIAGLGLAGGASGIIMGWLLGVAVRRSMLHTQESLHDAAKALQRVAGNVRSEMPVSDLDSLIKSMAESVSAVKVTLDQTRKDALRAEQLATVGQMAAGIAHEVRNPLMAMKVLVQSVAEDQSKMLDRRSIRVLDEEIVRVERIVSQFLDFARPPKLHRREVSLNRLIDQTIEELQARADLQGISFDWDATAEDVYAAIDVDQFHQLLYNLFLNAMDAQGKGGRIVVRVTPMEIGFELEVRDFGTGISNEILDRLFEPFVSSKESGLGLGLSICRRIVEAHGGRIEGKNTSSGGAVFQIFIPTEVDAAAISSRRTLLSPTV